MSAGSLCEIKVLLEPGQQFIYKTFSTMMDQCEEGDVQQKGGQRDDGWTDKQMRHSVK